LVDRLLLQFNTANFAESVLVVLEDGSGQELIENLGLSTGEGH